MIPLTHSESDANEESLQLDKAIGEYLQLVDDGHTVDRAGFIAKRPEIAEKLREYFQTEDAMVNLAGSDASANGQVSTNSLNTKTAALLRLASQSSSRLDC